MIYFQKVVFFQEYYKKTFPLTRVNFYLKDSISSGKKFINCLEAWYCAQA